MGGFAGWTPRPLIMTHSISIPVLFGATMSCDAGLQLMQIDHWEVPPFHSFTVGRPAQSLYALM